HKPRSRRVLARHEGGACTGDYLRSARRGCIIAAWPKLPIRSCCELLPLRRRSTMSRSRLLLLCCAVSFFTILQAPSAGADEGPLKGLDEYVQKAMKEWEVPGLGLTVIKDDKVVLAKGYGVRKLGEPAPVDAHTMFAIGSISKSFTATALGLLVDEGKIKWNDPAAKHMPGFELYDPYANKEMTIRDLLSHRSGLDRHELVWYGAGISRQEVLKRLRLVKPDWSFRGKFGYQNMMYLAAGEIFPAVAKK